MWCTKNIPNFKKLCEGIIFTGSRDGKVLVSYNTKLIYPLSYTLNDGETWEKVEKNREYLKKVAKVKNRFIPDLTIRPEDFGIENYEFDLNGFLNTRESVDLTGNNLISFPFKFGKVGGDFDCGDNNLTSLKGAPQKVGGDFYCAYNNLTSLEGAPQKVGGNFRCSDNNLTSLKGAPREVGGYFSCVHNNLTSLEGAPQKVGGNFNCGNNKTKFTKEDVLKICDVKGKITA